MRLKAPFARCGGLFDITVGPETDEAKWNGDAETDRERAGSMAVSKNIANASKRMVNTNRCPCISMPGTEVKSPFPMAFPPRIQVV
jgi:hypothetical protein